MSKSLIKLIDYSLLPAALMVVSKFLGMVIVVNLFSIDWGIESIRSSLFSIRPVFFEDDLMIVSTYSDLFMYLVIAIGFSLVLAQSLFLQNTRVSPQMLVKLANYNLLGLVKTAFEIYHKSAIWAIFLWVATGVLAFNVVIGKTAPWLSFVALVFTVSLTVALLRDVAHEIEQSRSELFSNTNLTK